METAHSTISIPSPDASLRCMRVSLYGDCFGAITHIHPARLAMTGVPTGKRTPAGGGRCLHTHRIPSLRAKGRHARWAKQSPSYEVLNVETQAISNGMEKDIGPSPHAVIASYGQACAMGRSNPSYEVLNHEHAKRQAIEWKRHIRPSPFHRLVHLFAACAFHSMGIASARLRTPTARASQ